ITLASKVYVLAKQANDIEPAKQVTLDDGEAMEGVDMSLARGGVITGRVTNAEGKPLIVAAMNLFLAPQRDGWTDYTEFGNQLQQMFQTDDRGVYRIYRLPAGRYILSAGGETNQQARSARDYKRTYYGDTTERKNASIIEVKEGAETSG